MDAVLVHFEQAEIFSDLLIKSFAGNLDGDTKRGFAAMNEALKARAEALEGATRARFKNVRSNPFGAMDEQAR